MAAFELKDYVGSKQSLDKGLALCSDARRQQLYERALRKCDAELKGTLIIVTLPYYCVQLSDMIRLHVL